MADEERALLESYWPDLDTLPVVFPTDRWWPRDIVIVDMTRGPTAIRPQATKARSRRCC